MGHRLPNTVFKFFPQKISYWLNKSRKLVLGHIFPNIVGSIGAIVSKNDSVYPQLDPHQPCEFHEKQFKTATYIICFCTYTNNYPAPFLSGQGGLKTSVTNVKSAVGLQTTMISHNAGSESTHPLSPCIPTFAGAFKFMFHQNSR